MGEKETDGLLVPRGPTKAPVHVAKRAQRNKALSVVFDPQDHKCVAQRMLSACRACPCVVRLRQVDFSVHSMQASGSAEVYPAF